MYRGLCGCPSNCSHTIKIIGSRDLTLSHSSFCGLCQELQCRDENPQLFPSNCQFDQSFHPLVPRRSSFIFSCPLCTGKCAVSVECAGGLSSSPMIFHTSIYGNTVNLSSNQHRGVLPPRSRAQVTIVDDLPKPREDGAGPRSIQRDAVCTCCRGTLTLPSENGKQSRSDLSSDSSVCSPQFDDTEGQSSSRQPENERNSSPRKVTTKSSRRYEEEPTTTSKHHDNTSFTPQKETKRPSQRTPSAARSVRNDVRETTKFEPAWRKPKMDLSSAAVSIRNGSTKRRIRFAEVPPSPSEHSVKESSQEESEEPETEEQSEIEQPIVVQHGNASVLANHERSTPIMNTAEVPQEPVFETPKDRRYVYVPPEKGSSMEPMSWYRYERLKLGLLDSTPTESNKFVCSTD